MNEAIICGSGDLSVHYVVEDQLVGAAHTHPEFQLFVPLATEALSARYETAAGSIRRLAHESGAVYLVDAHQSHSFAWNKLEMVSFFLSKQTFERVANDMLGKRLSLSGWYGLEDGLLPRLGLAIRDHYAENARLSRLFVESTCYVVAGRLVERIARRVVTSSLLDTPDRRVRAACDFVNERLGDDIGLTSLAAVAGLSPFHFLRTFRATVGMTPQRYILDQRLKRARKRLGRSRDTVSRIAADLGFASPSHLASAFRVRFGMAPSEYRKVFGVR